MKNRVALFTAVLTGFGIYALVPAAAQQAPGQSERGTQLVVLIVAVGRNDVQAVRSTTEEQDHERIAPGTCGARADRYARQSRPTPAETTCRSCGRSQRRTGENLSPG